MNLNRRDLFAALAALPIVGRLVKAKEPEAPTYGGVHLPYERNLERPPHFNDGMRRDDELTEILGRWDEMLDAHERHWGSRTRQLTVPQEEFDLYAKHIESLSPGNPVPVYEFWYQDAWVVT